MMPQANRGQEAQYMGRSKEIVRNRGNEEIYV